MSFSPLGCKGNRVWLGSGVPKEVMGCFFKDELVARGMDEIEESHTKNLVNFGNFVIDFLSFANKDLSFGNNVHIHLIYLLICYKFDGHIRNIGLLYVLLQRRATKSKNVVFPELLHEEMLIIIGRVVFFGDHSQANLQLLEFVPTSDFQKVNLVEFDKLLLQIRHIEYLIDNDSVTSSVSYRSQKYLLDADVVYLLAIGH